MHTTTTRSLLALATFAVLAAAAPVAPATASPLRGDVEVDPTAYALAGNSLHVGIGYRHLRLDLGNYAMALPQVVHGDDGFDVRFAGYGAKLQWFRRADQTGAFVGVDAGLARVHARLQGSDLAADDLQFSTGVNAGYRWSLGHGLYVTPWLGVGYAWSADDISLGGKTFAPSSVTVVPAVHLGYRFE